MTITEYKAALDTLDASAFATFCRDFGGDFATRQQYVDDFVHHPDHERRICQLLRLTTEQDKATAAGQDAVALSKQANQIAQDANSYSAAANVAARRANAIAKRATWISALALFLSIMALVIQALCGGRQVG